ncbi:MAG: hypothetical protein E7014_04700 [Alphaproteobacteria bacterium]|nr:hypothetical protein [Alphaproteobacteria bacterium]
MTSCPDSYNSAFFNFQPASHRLLADDTGMPLTVYHGTHYQFETFLPLSHFGTLYAAQNRIKTANPIKHTFSSLIESAGNLKKNVTLGFNLLLENLIKPTEKLTDTDRCIPVHLALRHPKRMDDMGFSRSTYKDDMLYRLIREQLLFGYRFHRHLTSVSKRLNALQQIINGLEVPPMYDFIFKNPFQISSSAVRRELGLENLYPVLGSLDNCSAVVDEKSKYPQNILTSVDKLNRERLCMQRMIRYWESLGYDGFIYTNNIEDVGAFSYVVFRPNQVIRLDRPPEYLKNPLYPSISNQKELDIIQINTLASMESRLITKAEAKRMEMWHLESNRFHERYG